MPRTQIERKEFPPEKTLFSTKEAAEYLGMPLQTLKHQLHNVNPPEIQADELVGPTLVFKRESLDKYLQDRRDNFDTIQAAEYLGIKKEQLYYLMFYMKPEEARLQSDMKRGDHHIFKKETLDRLKEQKPWKRRKRSDDGQEIEVDIEIEEGLETAE